jgi:hypothetical protein
MKNGIDILRNAHSLANLEKLRVRDRLVVNCIKNHMEGVELIIL